MISQARGDIGLSQCFFRFVLCHIQRTATLQGSPAAFDHSAHIQDCFSSLFTLSLVLVCLLICCPVECLPCSVSSVRPPLRVKLFNKPCELSPTDVCPPLPLFFYPPAPPPNPSSDGLRLMEHEAPNMESFHMLERLDR